MNTNIINAIGIWEGGGKKFLELFSDDFNSEYSLFCLDSRLRSSNIEFSKAKLIYFSPNLSGRISFTIFRLFFISKFILKNYHKTDHCLYEYHLNSMPPFIRFPSKRVIVNILIQNRLILTPSLDKLFKINFLVKLNILRIAIRLFLKRTDNIIIQTNSMAKSLIKFLKYYPNILIDRKHWKNYQISNRENLEAEKQRLSLIKNNKVFSKLINNNRKIKLFYPASYMPHKNHSILFDAMILLLDREVYEFCIIVTINQSDLDTKYRNLNNLIAIGPVISEKIYELYKEVDYLIFPSLCESLGLPLLEASSFNIPIIASSLDFVFEVCDPLITFNPKSAQSLAEAIIDAIEISKNK